MTKFIQIIACFLILIPVVGKGEANIRENIFQKRLQYEEVVGWVHPQHPKGGRSWKVADIIRFNKWLQEITVNKKQQLILKEWGIAHDCFDSVIALHFLYALKTGLALRYGKINSMTYASSPIKFLQLALKKYGTINAHKITYEVDLWQIENYQPGLIYLSPGKPGHAYYLSHFDPEFYAYKIEGPFPADFAKLKAALFTESVTNVGQSQYFYSFRRFPLYINHGDLITRSVPKEFPQSLKHHNQSWWNCVGDDTFYKRPLWENVKNFMSYHKKYRHSVVFSHSSRPIICKHNIYWDKNYVINPPIRPNYQKAVFFLTEELCRLLDERATRVNRGYRNCYEPLVIHDEQCTVQSNGIYSTPNFDQRIGHLTNNLANLVKYYGISRTDAHKLKDIKCGPFNFHQNTSEPSLFMKVPIYQEIDTNKVTFKTWLQDISDSTNTDAHDPKRPLTKRWGCESYDIDYKCLEPVTYDRIKAEEHIDYNSLVNYDYYLSLVENKVMLIFQAHVQGQEKIAIKSIRFSFLSKDTDFMFDFKSEKIVLTLDITPFQEEDVYIEFLDEHGDTLLDFILSL